MLILEKVETQKRLTELGYGHLIDDTHYPTKQLLPGYYAAGEISYPPKGCTIRKVGPVKVFTAAKIKNIYVTGPVLNNVAYISQTLRERLYGPE